MAKRFEITCIQMAHGGTSDEHIARVGGTGNGGWTLAVPHAARSADAGIWEFYVRDRRGAEVPVKPVMPTAGEPYLRSEANGVVTDNLRSLQRCPDSYKKV